MGGRLASIALGGWPNSRLGFPGGQVAGKAAGGSVDWMNAREMGIGRPFRAAELGDRLESGLGHCNGGSVVGIRRQHRRLSVGIQCRDPEVRWGGVCLVQILLY